MSPRGVTICANNRAKTERGNEHLVLLSLGVDTCL